MKRPTLYSFVVAVQIVAALSSIAAPQPIPLWPARAPGEVATLPPEVDVTRPTDRQPGGKPVVRISNVVTPTMTIYSPDPAKNTSAAMLVFPGGAYVRLCVDIEGTEVCEWFNSIGVTGILVKYRVPRREGVPQYVPPVQDAQRALGLVRQRATSLGIDPKRVGVIGFSAGAHVAAVMSNNFERRLYTAIDAADQESCRPDCAVLVYPGYLTGKTDFSIAEELPVSAKTPPTFLVQTEDDFARVENSLFYYLALKKAGVPAEMHLYSVGGHGYGLRHTGDPVETWPARLDDWMTAAGWLKPSP